MVLKFIAIITTVDTFLGLCEIRCIKNKIWAHVATRFYEMWLCRYPCPLCCIHNNGSEFISQEFQATLTLYGVELVPTTVKNWKHRVVRKEDRMRKAGWGPFGLGFYQQIARSCARLPPRRFGIFREVSVRSCPYQRTEAPCMCNSSLDGYLTRQSTQGRLRPDHGW